MLLRRYLEHFSTQNWTAIVLDFFIVVAGIFLGLQVDGWNESRKDAIREREHLEQLHTDFSKNAQALELMRQRHGEMASDMMFAIGEVKKETLDPDNEERFKWAILTMNQVPPMSLNMAGYRAMVAAGDFSLLRDKALRSLLVSIEAEIEFERNAYWRRSDASFGFPDDVSMRISRAIPHPSGKGVAFELDFEALKAYPDTLGVLANTRRMHAHISESRSLLRDLFLEANALIEKSLGPPY